MNEENQEQDDRDFATQSFGFGKEKGYDKASLVAQAVHNCLIKRSVEMRQGYKTHVLDKFGNALVKIIPDTRKEFIGSVIGLTGLLKYEIQKEIKEKYKEFEERKKEIKEKYIYHERVFGIKEDKEGNALFNNDGSFLIEEKIIPNGRKWIPEKTDLLPFAYTFGEKDSVGQLKNKSLIVKKREGIWDYEINQYWEEILELCDEWFGELNILISDKLDNFHGEKAMG